MAIKLSTVINTSGFFCQLFFIHNYRRMAIFYGIDVAEINSFMSLGQGVNSCLLLYKKRGSQLLAFIGS